MTTRLSPGAFTGVAATGAYDHGRRQAIPVASLLPLPPAVLVHHGHDFGLPIAIAVPRFVNGVIEMAGVFRSRSCGAWALSRIGTGLSLYAAVASYDGTDVVRATLVGVDLVPVPADSGARVRSMTAADDMTTAERETQRRLDAYLDDPANPCGFDFFAAAKTDGATALDPLAPVVAPILDTAATAA